MNPKVHHLTGIFARDEYYTHHGESGKPHEMAKITHQQVEDYCERLGLRGFPNIWYSFVRNIKDVFFIRFYEQHHRGQRPFRKVKVDEIKKTINQKP